MDAKVSAAKERRVKNEKLVSQGFQLDPSQKNAYQLRKGQWIKTDKNFDNELMLRKQYGELSKDGKAPLGELTVTSDFLGKLGKKKEAEEYLRELQLANYLIDSDIPESQERVFQIFGELKDVPDKEFMQFVTHQEALRIMLRDGVVRGKDDHALIVSIMKPDYLLPTTPIWDNEGKLLGSAPILELLKNITVGELIKAQNAVTEPVRQLYNPKTYSYDTEIDGLPGSVKDLNILLKIAILKRLYPGIKKEFELDENKNKSTAELEKWLVLKFGNSPITNKPMHNKYLTYVSEAPEAEDEEDQQRLGQ